MYHIFKLCNYTKWIRNWNCFLFICSLPQIKDKKLRGINVIIFCKNDQRNPMCWNKVHAIHNPPDSHCHKCESHKTNWRLYQTAVFMHVYQLMFLARLHVLNSYIVILGTYMSPPTLQAFPFSVKWIIWSRLKEW